MRFRSPDPAWPEPNRKRAAHSLQLAAECERRCLPAAIFAPLVPAAWMALAAMCFVTFGHAIWVANLQALPIDLFRGPEVGTATGFSGMGGAIGGALANLGTGWVVQRFSYAPIFALAGLMHPMSIALLYWLLPERCFRGASDGRVKLSS